MYTCTCPRPLLPARTAITPTERSLVVYRDQLPNASETYIRAPGETVRRYQSRCVCMRRISGLHLPRERVIVLNPGTGAVDCVRSRSRLQA